MVKRFIYNIIQRLQSPSTSQNHKKQTKKNVASGLSANDSFSRTDNQSMEISGHSNAQQGRNSMK